MRFDAALSRWICGALAWLALLSGAHGQDLPEYRLKAAFLYNFALFTEWPAVVGPTLELCVFGGDPFGVEVDALQGKTVGNRSITVRRVADTESLGSCQMVFIAAAGMAEAPRVLQRLHDKPTLTVADSAGATHQGVAINMTLQNAKVSFEVNLKAAREAGLTPSAKLLRLATQVLQ